MAQQGGAVPAAGSGPSVNSHHRRQVGARLRLLRRALGLPAKQLAAELGVKATSWSQWEHGHHPPNLAAMIRLVRRSRATLDYIYLGDDSGMPRRLLDAIRALPPDESITNQ